MNRISGLALGLCASLYGWQGAQAAEPVLPIEPIQQPVLAPVEHVSPWAFEIGARYWFSTGETSWNHTADSPFLGSPASVLQYEDLDAHSGEVFGRISHISGLFLKGYAGLGEVVDGSLQDQDFFVGQIEFSDTFSDVRDGELMYGSVDLGWFLINRHFARDMWSGVRLGGFAGYHHWNEEVDAFGVRCNPDDVGGFFCGAPGTIAVPFSTNVISNEVEWRSFRVGVIGELDITPRLHLSGEAAYVPTAEMDNKDSHHLRTDLGPVPNIRMDGDGDGWMLEGVLSYDVAEMFSVGLGGRYWKLESDGTIRFGTDFAPALRLNDLDSERYGVFLQGSIKLN